MHSALGRFNYTFIKYKVLAHASALTLKTTRGLGLAAHPAKPYLLMHKGQKQQRK